MLNNIANETTKFVCEIIFAPTRKIRTKTANRRYINRIMEDTKYSITSHAYYIFLH